MAAAPDRSSKLKQWVTSLWNKSSNSGDEEPPRFQVPQNIFESYAAKVKQKYPNASDKVIRAKARAIFNKTRQKEIEKRANQIVFHYEDSDESLNLDDVTSIRPRMMAPLNKLNDKSQKEIKAILTTIDIPQKLSHLLLNPITNVERMRLITDFTNQMMKSSPTHRAMVRGNVFHIAMVHTEGAIVHQLIVDRVHRDMIRRGSKWGFKSVLQPDLRFSSKRTQAEARGYINEFNTCFDTLMQLTHLVMPRRTSIISFQEALAMLVLLSDDDKTLETWPPSLASGSEMFGNLYTDMFEASFTSEEASQRYNQMNETRSSRSREATSRKNRSLLMSLHLAADPTSEDQPLTEGEEKLIEDLTTTIHPFPTRPTPSLQQFVERTTAVARPSATSTQVPPPTPLSPVIQDSPIQMPSAILPPMTPVTSQMRGPGYNPDVLCNLEQVVWPDQKQVPVEKVYAVLNKHGAGLSLRPQHRGLTVDLSYLPSFSSARLADVHDVCLQAFADFDALSYAFPPPYASAVLPDQSTPLLASGGVSSAHATHGGSTSQDLSATYVTDSTPRRRVDIYGTPLTFPDTPPESGSEAMSPPQPDSREDWTCCEPMTSTHLTPLSDTYALSPNQAVTRRVPQSERPPVRRQPVLRQASSSARAQQLLQQIRELWDRIEAERASPQSQIEVSRRMIQNWNHQADEKMLEYGQLIGGCGLDPTPTPEEMELGRRAREDRLHQRRMEDIKKTIQEELSSQLAEQLHQSLNFGARPKDGSRRRGWTKAYETDRYLPNSQPTPEGFRGSTPRRGDSSADFLTFKHRPVETRAQAQARNRPPAAQPNNNEPPVPSDLYTDDEETRRRMRDQYKAIEPIRFDDDASLYVERLMSLIPYMYRYKPANSVLYNFLYAKCSKEVQELIATSGAVEQGDYEALEEFLIAKVGRKSRPTNEFAELKRTRDKRTWKELIRRVEKMVNDESFREADDAPLVVRQRQYREKILQLCDEALTTKLNDHGFLRPGKFDYDELCEFLYDQDANQAIMNSRTFRHNVVEDTPQTAPVEPAPVGGNDPWSIRNLAKAISNLAFGNSQSKKQSGVAPKQNKTKAAVAQPRSAGESVFPAPRSQAQRAQPGPDKKAYPDINAGRWCNICPNKASHLIAKCPNIEWFPRRDPIPTGSNDTCPPSQYCFARSGSGGYCKSQGHRSQFCPTFQCRVKPQSS